MLHENVAVNDRVAVALWLVSSKNVFTVFVAGLPRKPKLPLQTGTQLTLAVFPKPPILSNQESYALLPIASAILQNGAIRFVWQSLPPHQSTPVPTKQMPYPCNHRQQGFFVPHQDYPCHVPRLAGSLSIRNIRRRYRKGMRQTLRVNRYMSLDTANLFAAS